MDRVRRFGLRNVGQNAYHYAFEALRILKVANEESGDYLAFTPRLRHAFPRDSAASAAC
jgi:hypothetical protein